MVTAIIPARNEEASIARAVESVAAQPEVGEIIVVNDQSSDGTGAILERLAARIPKLKVISAGELPVGWVGKNYAASIGAAAAQSDWLLFTDADTYHYPGSTRRALADAVDHDAVLVSYSPEQELETFWERALIPFVFWRLSTKYSYERINDQHEADAAANGQYLMVRSDIYHMVGGHAAVSSEVLEDVALARKVKRAVRRIYFASGQGIVRTRMYRNFRAMWEGWTKNLYPLMADSSSRLLGELAAWVLFVGGAVLTVAGMWGHLGHGVQTSGSAFIAAALALYGWHLKRNRYPSRYILYFIPGLCLYVAALIVSWWKTKQGSVIWKGRAYPAKT